jgi:RNA polymerase sigma factor (sigma-70 family)
MSADSSQPPQPAALPGEATVLVQQLFVRYQPQLRSFVLALTGDFVATDDIVQEVFLTITAKAADFRPDASFRHWMLAIARFKVLESRRAARRFSPRVIESLAAALQPDALAEDRLEPLLECKSAPQVLPAGGARAGRGQRRPVIFCPKDSPANGTSATMRTGISDFRADGRLVRLVPRFPMPNQLLRERLPSPLQWHFSAVGAESLRGRPPERLRRDLAPATAQRLWISITGSSSGDT